jgi:hypothetical protein
MAKMQLRRSNWRFTDKLLWIEICTYVRRDGVWMWGGVLLYLVAGDKGVVGIQIASYCFGTVLVRSLSKLANSLEEVSSFV